MGRIVKHNLPCLDSVECGSSDARQLYEDGTSFCFSCKTFFEKGDDMKSAKSIQVPKKASEGDDFKIITPIDEVLTYPIQPLVDRKIAKEICEFFGVRVSYGGDGKIDTHYYPYGKESFKVRHLPKKFSWINKVNTLFGQEKFSADGMRLIICEGEIDALSVAQAVFDRYQKIYPVVALPSSTMTKVLVEQRTWIRSFKEVVLCFDEDEAGHEAQENAIKIIGFDKVKIAKLPCNDANDVLKEHGSKRLNQCIWDAEKYPRLFLSVRLFLFP